MSLEWCYNNPQNCLLMAEAQQDSECSGRPSEMTHIAARSVARQHLHLDFLDAAADAGLQPVALIVSFAGLPGALLGQTRASPQCEACAWLVGESREEPSG